MYKYTQDFWNKYQNNQDMLDIGNKCAYYLAGAYISDEDFCIICEAMYGYKLGTADKYGLSMDSAFENLKYLSGIYHGDQYFTEGQENWLGYFTNEFGTEKPAYICIKASSGENYKESLMHEIYHLISTNYELDINNIPINMSYGLQNTPYIDEILTQRATINSMLALGMEIPQSSSMYSANYLSVQNVEINNSANGYSNIVNFADQLECVIGPELYKQKFEGNGAFNNYLLSDMSTINNYIEKFFEKEDIPSYIAAQKILVDKLIMKFDTEPGYSTIDYLRELQTIRELSGSIYISTSTGDEKANIIDLVSQSREIEMFYCSLSSKSPDTQLDTSTRDKECVNYILALTALKENVINYTDSSFSTFSYSQMKDGTLQVSYQGETFFVKGRELENGFIKYDETGPMSEYKKPKIHEQIISLFRKDESAHPTITDAQKIDMAQFTDSVDVKIKCGSATLWDIAATKREFSYNSLLSALENTNIYETMKYGNNELNICHLLASNDNLFSSLAIKAIAEQDIDTLRVLLQKEDSSGHKPLDYISDFNSSQTVSSLIEIGKNNPAISGIVNDAYEERYVPEVSEETHAATNELDNAIHLDL